MRAEQNDLVAQDREKGKTIRLHHFVYGPIEVSDAIGMTDLPLCVHCVISQANLAVATCGFYSFKVVTLAFSQRRKDRGNQTRDAGFQSLEVRLKDF